MNGTAATMGSNNTVITTLRQAETGAPAWVDLRTSSGTAEAARFYCSLFGWTVVARHRPLDESAGYWVFQHGDVAVGGLSADDDPAWTMYVRVADVRATVASVVAHGGTVVAEPVRTLDGGRLAVCADPLGATFAVWEAAVDGPLVAEPAPVSLADAVATSSGSGSGSAAGFQLLCADAAQAAGFYAAVLGWTAEIVPCAAGTRCTRFRHPVTGRLVGMAVEAGDSRPGSAQWTVHLPVADADDAVALATNLGGSVTVEPFDLPDVGRVAVLHDPEHTTFSIVQIAA